MAADDDGDVFEITDFTTASDWERFISRVEEILHEWKLVTSVPKLPAPKGSYADGIWEERTEELNFSTFQFTLSHVRLKCEDDTREKSAEKESGEDEADDTDTEVLPTVYGDLMNMDNDFPSRAHCICRWYGLQDFVTLSPSGNESAVLGESKVKSLLSSVNIALADAGCTVPVFIQINQKWRRLYFGTCMLSDSTLEFGMIQLKRTPAQYNHLAGLLDVFKSKLGSVIDPRPPVSVAVRFLYVMYDWINSPWSQPLPDFDHEVGCSGFDKLPFGACEDPVSALNLNCTWPSLSEDMIVENQVYSDLDPLQAPHWSVRIQMTDDPQCLLGEYLTEFIALCHRKDTLEQIMGNFGSSDLRESDSTGDISNALQKLTEPSISYNIPSLSSYVVQQPSKTPGKSTGRDAPIQGELLTQILQFLFPDSAKPMCGLSTDESEAATSTPATKELPKQLKSAPVSGLLHRLSVCLCVLNHNNGGLFAMAQMWQEFILEMRYRWDNNYFIDGVEKGAPNLGSCLLQQKLQMLNCCIEHKKKREQLHKGYTGELDSPPESPFRGPSTAQISRSLSCEAPEALADNEGGEEGATADQGACAMSSVSRSDNKSSKNKTKNSDKTRDNRSSHKTSRNQTVSGVSLSGSSSSVGSSRSRRASARKSSAIKVDTGRPDSPKIVCSSESSDDEFFECNYMNENVNQSDEKDIDTTTENQSAENESEAAEDISDNDSANIQQTTESDGNDNQSAENMDCDPAYPEYDTEPVESPSNQSEAGNASFSSAETGSLVCESVENMSVMSDSAFKESFSHKPEGRLAHFGELRLINCDERMYIPVTQEPAPMTEDMLEEHAEVLAKLGTSAEGAVLRARMQSACLLSDMESFKAANPGSVLEDFVRWYSPRDWVEDEVETANGDVKIEGHLSPRMQIPGNMWVEVWQTARPTPARRQKRLFDDTKEAEKVFHFLASLKLSDVVVHLLPMLIHAALLKAMDNEDTTIPVLDQVIEQACLKASQVTRSPNQDVKRYEEVIRIIRQAEILIARNISLRSKFTVELLEHEGARQELDHFVSSILQNSEVPVRGGPMGPAGSVIAKLFHAAQRASYMILDDDDTSTDRMETSAHSHLDEDGLHNSTVPNFPRPAAREYILRTLVPRPAPYSKQLPQRMFCSIEEDEFRLAGAFSSDAVFQ